jgi:molecular chaperone DnaJ
MASKDYYQTLGVPRDAGKEDIRKAYKELARKYHPDVNPGDKAAEERFKEIAEAYAVLGDSRKRQEYDARGPEGFSAGFDPSEVFRRARAGGFQPFDLSSLFDDFLGGMRGGRAGAGRGRGADVRAGLTIDFEDAIRGVTLPLTVSRTAPCDTCGGGGQGPGGGGPCPECGGQGQRQVVQGPLQFSAPCGRCGGSGRSPGPPCPACGGSGGVPRTESITVRIPAGVDEGSRVRLAGKGEAGRGGGPPGDLYVEIHVRPHPFFRREGEALICQLPLTLAEATLGAKVDVPTLDGTSTMTVPPGTRSGQRFRIKDKGVRRKTGGRGPLYVDVQIVPPSGIDDESRRLLEEFARRNPQPDLRGHLDK